ncbi:hypothetical protein Acr_08g0011050 [Actinidia rufa]|uniref:Uncharacterized protein n=1 Tax=Actinidia rufa TaxID=165716 RepID=A0A7J0F3A6_9ERIC|nr:hypothetical protein Acr_08g0011050 [Actinidia rufa]
MGKFSKKPRKEEECDSSSQDDNETEEMLTLENRYDEGDEFSDYSEEEREEDVDGGEQNDIRNDAEMEELEKEFSDLRHQEQ